MACAERREIAVRPPSVDHRSRVLTSANGGFRILERHKAVAFGTAGVFIGDDDCFQDLPELVEVAAHGFSLRFPREPANEDLRESRVHRREMPSSAAAGEKCPVVRRHARSTATEGGASRRKEGRKKSRGGSL